MTLHLFTDWILEKYAGVQSATKSKDFQTERFISNNSDCLVLPVLLFLFFSVK